MDTILLESINNKLESLDNKIDALEGRLLKTESIQTNVTDNNDRLIEVVDTAQENLDCTNKMLKDMISNTSETVSISKNNIELINTIIKRLEVLELKLDNNNTEKIIDIIESLNKRLEALERRVEDVVITTGRMDGHIDFVEGAYKTVRAPLEYITSKIYPSKEPLPLIEHNHS